MTNKIDSEKGEKMLKKIAKGSIYLLVFLLPLFFLPWTSNVLEFNKQALLLLLVFVSLTSWLASILVSNRLEINVSFLHLPIVTLLLVIGITTIFSLSSYGSFWGWPLIIPAGFVSLLVFSIFYFLVANLFKKEEIHFLDLITLIMSILLI